MNSLPVFVPLDIRLVARDGFLRWLVLLPLAIALLLRWLLPALLPPLGAALGLDLLLFAPQFTTAIVLPLTPLLYGQLIGLLLLDQRDEGTLLALHVTPLAPWLYRAYRLALPSALGLIVTPLAFILADAADLSFAQALLCALAAVPVAPCVALGLAALAANKVQGLALMKASGVLLAAPLAIPFLPMPGQLLLGISPTYWPVRFSSALLAGEALGWAFFLAGWLYSALLASLLLRLEATRPPPL